MSLSGAEYIRYIADKYSFYASIVNLVIGSIGNIFLILILLNTKIFQRNQCSFYFIIESFSDIILISTLYISHILTTILGYDPILTSIVWCKMRSMIVQGCGLYSLLTISCMTMDLFLATHSLYILRQLSTLKLAYRLAIFNICFTILHSSIFLVFNEIQSLAGCSVYNSTIRKYLSFFYYPLLANTFSLLCTIIFSLLAYRNVCRIVRRQISIVRRRLDQQLTSMVLTRVISIIICGVPYICTTLYSLNIDNNGNQYLKLAILSLITIITDTLLMTNFCINFYLFLCVSSRFRRQVKHFLIKYVWRQLKSCCLITNRNQVAPQIIQRNISILLESL